MPGGIGGRELADQLRQRRPGLKSVFTSGYSAELAGGSLHPEDSRYFIQKPATLSQILTTIRQCLDE